MLYRRQNGNADLWRGHSDQIFNITQRSDIILTKVCMHRAQHLSLRNKTFDLVYPFYIDCKRSKLISFDQNGRLNLVFSNREQSKIEAFNLEVYDGKSMPDTLYKPALKRLTLQTAEFVSWIERTSQLEEKLSNLQELTLTPSYQGDFVDLTDHFNLGTILKKCVPNKLKLLNY